MVAFLENSTWLGPLVTHLANSAAASGWRVSFLMPRDWA